jgi:hypothetical protein
MAPALQLGELLEFAASKISQPGSLLLCAFRLHAQLGDTLVDEPFALLVAPAIQAGLHFGQQVLVAAAAFAFFVRIGSRQQGFDLPARGHHGLVGGM